jgi:hypothetical protein
MISAVSGRPGATVGHPHDCTGHEPDNPADDGGKAKLDGSKGCRRRVGKEPND